MCSPRVSFISLLWENTFRASPRFSGKDSIFSFAPLLLAHVVDVLLHRLRRGQVLFHAIQAGGEHDGELQIGVSGRVRVAQLHSGPRTSAGRHADQGAAVHVGPGDVAGRFVSRHQALVRVHMRGQDGAVVLGVRQQSAQDTSWRYRTGRTFRRDRRRRSSRRRSTGSGERACQTR